MPGIRKSLTLLTILSVVAIAYAMADEPLRFTTADHGEPGGSAPIKQPWRTVTPYPQYSDMDGETAVWTSAL